MIVSLYPVSKTNGRDVTYGSLRRFEQLVQTIPYPPKELSEHLVKTIRIARRDYLNDPKVPPSTSSAAQIDTWHRQRVCRPTAQISKALAD